MAWNMVRHAFAMIFRNIGAALQTSVGPILIAMAISFGAMLAVGLSPELLVTLAVNPRQMSVLMGAAPTTMLIGILFLMLVYIFVFAWICVAWHRFILLEEAPGTIPPISGRPIWLYVGTTVLLALLLVLLAIPLTLVLRLMAAPLIGPNADATSLPLQAIGLLVDAALSYLWFRFAVVLPAAAIGRPMTLGDGWTATGRAAGTILGAVAILMGLTVLSGFGLLWLARQNLWVGFGSAIVVQWLTLMMGASILTTIYGVTVEKRVLR